MAHILDHPILGPLKNEKYVTIIVDGKEIQAIEGEPIAAALLANGIKIFRYTHKFHEPRGLFCGIGQCTDCIMEVDGVPNVRTCVTPVKEGMQVRTQLGFGKGSLMNNYDVIVVGAGPAGLGAAIEAARFGAKVLLLDENPKPGGQLFKQIHKFFGSKEHYAGVRGFKIGEILLQEAASLGVTFKLNTRVWGVFPGGIVTAHCREQSLKFSGRKIVLATGATENVLSFPGNTLPGVITAGAAQTMVNLYRVLPGKKFVIVGSGNVGLIVAYQLRQAGAEVLAIVEALPKISGYEVHAAKVKRAGVKILLSHTVKEARGKDILEQVVLHKLDQEFKAVPGSEIVFEADTLCLAVGLSPRLELAAICGCRLVYSPVLGGMMPWHDENMCTSNDRILVAGDLAGVEEASTALDEGRLAGMAAVQKLGLGDPQAIEKQMAEVKERLNKLRQGPFGEKRLLAKREIISMVF